jgi:hypothetical protein
MRVRDTGPDVRRHQFRVIVENSLYALALGKQAQDQLDRNAHTPDDGFASEDFRVGSDPIENGFIHFHYSRGKNQKHLQDEADD